MIEIAVRWFPSQHLTVHLTVFPASEIISYNQPLTIVLLAATLIYLI